MNEAEIFKGIGGDLVERDTMFFLPYFDSTMILSVLGRYFKKGLTVFVQTAPGTSMVLVYLSRKNHNLGKKVSPS
jgi:hypothetical protein